jgi:hypothetical protein
MVKELLLTTVGQANIWESVYQQGEVKVKLSQCLIKHHILKACWEVLCSLLTSAVDRGEWSASCTKLLWHQVKSPRYPLNGMGLPLPAVTRVEFVDGTMLRILLRGY